MWFHINYFREECLPDVIVPENTLSLYTYEVTPDGSCSTGSALSWHTHTYLCRLHRTGEFVIQTKAEGGVYGKTCCPYPHAACLS